MNRLISILSLLLFVIPMSAQRLPYQPYEENGKWGFKDADGMIVISPQWKSARISFRNKSDIVHVEDFNGKFGFIDSTGKTVIPFIYSAAGPFSEGLAAVRDDTRKWGYIDITGKVVIPFQWSYASFFSDGLSKVKDENRKYGYIDKTGTLVVPCQWAQAHLYFKRKGGVEVEDSDGVKHFIPITQSLPLTSDVVSSGNPRNKSSQSELSDYDIKSKQGVDNQGTGTTTPKLEAQSANSSPQKLDIKAEIKEEMTRLKTDYPAAKIKKKKEDDGSIYIGEVEKKTKQKSGHGTCFYADGSIYRGQWGNNKPEGDGTMEYANGSSYKGAWLAGMRSGQGKLIYNNGEFREGEWRNDLFISGMVKEVTPKGIYVGRISNGAYSGHGIMIYKNGNKYDGMWENGRFSGKGEMIYASGEIKSYNGEWADGEKTGEGKAIYKTGDEKNGSWRAGEFFSGRWTKSDKMSIEGMAQSNGRVFVGEGFTVLEDGKFNGKFSISPKTERLMFLEGTFSRMGKKLSGKWTDKMFKEGEVDIIYPIKVKGKIDNSSFSGVIDTGLEIFDGVYNKNGLFEGKYSVFTPEKEIRFVGQMENGKPKSGKVENDGNSTLSAITFSYPDDKTVVLEISDEKGRKTSITKNYQNNATLLSEVSQLSLREIVSSPNNIFESTLEGEAFYARRENYPMDRVFQDVYLLFYEDGYAIKKWENGNMHFSTDNRNKKRYDSFCPGCNGKGYTIYNGFTVKGEPYSERVRCSMCGGSGWVKANNAAANMYKDLWDEAFVNSITVTETITDENGNTVTRNSREVSRLEGLDVYHYKISGNIITLIENNESYKLKNGSLFLDGVEYYTITNGPKYYDDWRHHVNSSLSSQQGGTDIIVGQFSDPYFWLTIKGIKLHFPNNVLYYKSNEKCSFKTSGLKIISHEFQNGIGKIVTDKDIKEFNEKAVSVSSYGSSYAMMGLGYSSSSLDSEQSISGDGFITGVILPATIKHIQPLSPEKSRLKDVVVPPTIIDNVRKNTRNVRTLKDGVLGWFGSSSRKDYSHMKSNKND